MKNLIWLLIIGISIVGCSKNEGCMSSTATNYDSTAEKDDGSCVYASTSTAETSAVETEGSSTSNKSLVDVTNESDMTITPNTFSDLNGADVASKIAIEGSSTKEGSPSSPTGEYEAPIIYETSYENLRVRNGDKMTLGINGSNLEKVQGVYLKVHGSDQYFDAPVTINNNEGGRFGKPNYSSNKLNSNKRATSGSNGIDLEIEIPSSISQGTFCISYCLYTTDGQIGNVVTKCIDVQEFGSTTATFVGVWDFTQAVANIDGVIETIEKGKPIDWFDDEEQNTCGKKEQFSLDQFLFSIASNGGVSMDLKASASYFSDSDESGPVCSSYTTETEQFVETGAWAYNESTKTFTILYVDGYFDEFKLVHSGNNLSLVISDGSGSAANNIVYDFVKK